MTTGQKNLFQADKLVLVNCTRSCSLNEGNIPAGVPDMIIKWFQDGASLRAVQERLAEMDVHVSTSATGRHRKDHLKVARDVLVEGQEQPKKSDLEVLETIIQRGSQQVDLSSSKISAEQLLRAIELKHRLTEGSVFDQMYEAMRGAPAKDLDAPEPPPDDPALDKDDQNEA